MTRFFISALALLGMGVWGTEADAQFYVVKDGKVIFTLAEGTPDYVTFENPIDDDTPGGNQTSYNGTVGTPVDLGLTSGTLWADHNIGATNASDAGDYYQWGEVETHYSAGGNTNNPTWKEGYSAGYDWSTYKWCNGTYDTQTKYCTSSSYGTVDNKKELEDADDVAVQTWGGTWKMPTYEQQTELRNECYWVWTNTYKGQSVSGYIVYKAKSDSDKGVKVYDGNTPSSDYDVATDAHIFLPAAGGRWDAGLNYVGSSGYYWSRSLHTNYSFSACRLYFDSSRVDWLDDSRLYGFSVRLSALGFRNNHVTRRNE